MPIKSLVDNPQNKAEFSVGRDIELVYCSDSCLLQTLNDHSRIVRTGQTPATALTVILDADRLLVPIAGNPRTDEHILGAQHGHSSARANWTKLVGSRHASLMPVHRVCDCMAETQILEGQEFDDAGTTPAWKKVRSIVGKTTSRELSGKPIAFDQWRIWMGDLAQGLDELERLGLAHGDPYPFNAVRHLQQATWVDFGHMTSDAEQLYKDAWAFVLFTVLHTQSQCSTYSPALLQRIASAMERVDQPGRFARIRAVLLQSFGDQVPMDDVRTPGLIFVKAVTENSQNLFAHPAVPQLILKAAAQYFSAFMHHVKHGNYSFAAFQTELQRHRFQEEEMLRLTVPRAEHFNQLDALRTSQQQVVAQRDEEIARVRQTVIHKDEEIARVTQSLLGKDSEIEEHREILVRKEAEIANQNQRLAENERQATQIRHELDSLFKRHEQVLNSRSWRLTRPLRAAARFAKYGFNYPGGRQALYRFAANVGRKFPFPFWLKARVRAALIPKAPLIAAPTRASAPSTDSATFTQAPQASNSLVMRPECCGLVKDLVSVVLPVYNQAYLIAESIDSVLAQTYQNFELIIINDGSKDDVEKVLERYLDHPKIRCYTQANQRLPKALSNGFDFARGEFRTWTSADNIMEPRMLEELVARLRGDPSLGMVYGDYLAIDDRGELLKDTSWRAHNRPDPKSAEIRLPHSTETLNTVQDNFIGPCFMYRGWIGSCIGDYDTQLGIEDYDYWMRINAFFPLGHAGNDRMLYRYRVHDNTLSAQAQEHKILDKVQLLMEYEKERAAQYGKPLIYVADQRGADWLAQHGVAPGSIHAFGALAPTEALLVLGSQTAEEHLPRLRDGHQPVAVLLDPADIRYDKLRQLLQSTHAVALVGDGLSAERVRLIASCPILDCQAPSALSAVTAFAKNLMFIRATRDPQAMQRAVPAIIRSQRQRHVLLQVDSFTQGGMENVVIDLGLSLKSSGYRVTIANFGNSGDAAVKAVERGLDVVPLSSGLSDDAYLAWLSENRVDLVNAHYSIRGAAACHRAGIPFIQTVHNSYVWLDAEQIARYREADLHTTQYLCVSVTAARYADVALGLDAGKMRVVPNGIDPETIDAEHFTENRSDLRSVWGVDADAPVFVNVASIMATKAQLPLVKAFARVVERQPKARLVLLGTSMEAAYQSAVKNAVRDLGLQNHVLFAGYERNVARFYHAADVFVLPSYWEGWSLSLGEAMANGLGCVITDVGSAYEFEGRDNVEVVSPPFGDITALNYQNLGHFVYGTDVDFEERLASAMIRLMPHRRGSVDRDLAKHLDRAIAYRMYADYFSTL
ncbi:glycosyltransferase [Diaphorobacter caeni]|uniref:glycosyltransferase n=1 Tax=Diaphorobacter caeni TaxID=2784387 RepID=UPI00188F4C5D|nr:glycosyltransferase [Diaphorobacter caeni]MBF5005934.1 glycosyltransferase [Diaphorobacter caeni]